MSRSWESATPIALRYSSFERKCVSSERCRSASVGADAAPPGRGCTASGVI